MRSGCSRKFQKNGECVGVEEDSFVLSKQTHTTNVRVVTAKDREKGL